MQRYAKKITTGDCYLRAVSAESNIGRFQSLIRTGEEHMSSLGRYVLWEGEHRAMLVQKPVDSDPDTLWLLELGSKKLIVPAVASDWIGLHFDRETFEPNRADPAETRTGQRFVPKKPLRSSEPDQDGLLCCFDMSIRPPRSSKPSERGYEYAMIVRVPDPRFDPMPAIFRLGGTLPPLLPGLVADAPPDDPHDANGQDRVASRPAALELHPELNGDGLPDTDASPENLPADGAAVMGPWNGPDPVGDALGGLREAPAGAS